MAGKNKKILGNITYFVIQTIKSVFLMKQAACRFEPSCSVYARDAIVYTPLYKAIPKIIWRVLRCNPLFKGGYDPVLEKNHAMKGELK